MFKKFNTPLKSAAILGLVLAVALSSAWAATYYESRMVGHDGKTLRLNPNANLRVRNGGLDGYLAENGITEVEISVELTEVFDPDGNLDGLIFEFGTSGCYFDPPCKLRLKNEYINTNHTLVDENGEVIEYTVRNEGDKLMFEIPHFSSYYYDDYDGY